MAGLIDRVKNIILTPKSEWPVIDTESGDTKEVFTYVAIVSLFTFIGLLLVGLLFGGLSGALLTAIVFYGLTFLGVYVMAFVIGALAPTFNSEKHMPSALKLVAYAATPAWIAGIFGFIPVLGRLASLAGGIYAIYLLYLGLPIMMRTPQDKIIGYLIVAIVCAVVLWLVIFFFAAFFLALLL